MARILRYFFGVVLPWIILAHTAVFLAFWLTNNLFYSSTNDYLTNLIGRRMDYVSLCLLISAFLGAWSIARIILNHLGRRHRLSTLTAWLYGLFSIVYLLFFYGSFWLLLRESPVQLPRLGQMLSYFRILLDVLILLGAALLLGLWQRRAVSRRKAEGTRLSFLPLILGLTVLVLLWILPLAFPPGSVYKGVLPDKPLIIAHRGASMLAPENTLASARLAADLRAYGLETDIRISQDGKLFLMHDDTLKRTTDVATVFPRRQDDPVESFTLAEIERLNAGKWFVEQDPFKAIARGKVSPAQVQEFQTQKVPTLAEELDIVRRDNLVFIFDLYHSPGTTPPASILFDAALKQIAGAGTDPQIWFLVDKDQLAQLKTAAPAMKAAYGVDFRTPPSASDLQAQGYQIVNAEYGLSTDWIDQYLDQGLWVNLYTIDEPWQFSRLWLLGVDSTTSSNLQALTALYHPVFSLPYTRYIILWSLFGLLGLGLLLGLALPAYRMGD